MTGSSSLTIFCAGAATFGSETDGTGGETGCGVPPAIFGGNGTVDDGVCACCPLPAVGTTVFGRVAAVTVARFDGDGDGTRADRLRVDRLLDEAGDVHDDVDDELLDVAYRRPRAVVRRLRSLPALLLLCPCRRRRRRAVCPDEAADVDDDDELDVEYRRRLDRRPWVERDLDRE